MANKENWVFARLDADERASLDKLCQAEERSRSDIVRRALRHYAAGTTVEQLPTKEAILGRWLLALPVDLLDLIARSAVAAGLPAPFPLRNAADQDTARISPGSGRSRSKAGKKRS